jgi:hypothetical protein
MCWTPNEVYCHATKAQKVSQQGQRYRGEGNHKKENHPDKKHKSDGYNKESAKEKRIRSHSALIKILLRYYAEA